MRSNRDEVVIKRFSKNIIATSDLRRNLCISEYANACNYNTD
jgi:hypothetical protein